MSQKTSLAQALGAHERRPKPSLAAPAAAPAPKRAEPQTSTSRPPSRRGKKVLNVHVEPEVSKQIRQLALDQDSTVQNVVIEALNDLFAKYQRPPLA